MNNLNVKDIWKSISIFNKNFYQKPIGLHIAWGTLFVSIIVMVVLFFLDQVTGHTEYYIVPNVVNKSSDEALRILKNYNLRGQITDSIYTAAFPPNTIIKQIPDPMSQVKKGRNVFLVINRSKPPKIQFPHIKGMTYSTAIDILKLNGLYVSDTLYRNDIAKNLVLEHYSNGVPIVAGHSVALGTGITLVIGNGNASSLEYVWVPTLIGKSYLNAKVLVESLGISISLPAAMKNLFDADLDALIIERQEPNDFNAEGRKNKIIQGGSIKIWFKGLE